ncbi:MAG TPA: WD40 repeat domain-containing protein [Gemmata sp.]|nr:WD40 repeat domain-containing protein [Gemmata sp.]
MPFAARALFFSALAVAVSLADGPAQPAPAPDAKDLLKKFQAEREQALKAKFPPESIARADEFAKRAEAALKADNPKAAARYLRDARWQLPYLPSGLPPHVLRVFGESRMRHVGRVNALSFSPDGTRIASSSKDGTVKVWELANGREVATYRGHVDQADDPTKGGTVGGTNVLGVADVAFHPKDPKVIVSACGNQVHTWDPETGKVGKTLLNIGKTDKPLKALAFSPDGKSLAVGGDDGVLRVVDFESGKATYTSPSRNARIEKVAYSPNGNMVAAGDSNSQVAVYAPKQSNQLAMTVQGADVGGVYGVAFTADSGAVFAAGDGKARLIAGPKPDGTTAGNTATRLREFAGHTGTISGLAVVPDGSALVTGGEDKTLRVWEVTSGKQLRSFQGHMTGLTAVAVRGDGRQIASASEDGAVRVWDLNTEDDHRAMTDATDSLWAVAYSPDGKRVAAAGSDRTVRVYDPETGKLEAALAGAKSPVTSLAFLADSNRLAAAGGDQTVVVWDVGQKKVLKELAGHESAVLSLAVADDGKILSGSADKTVRAFDPAGDKAAWEWKSRSAVCAVAVRKGAKHAAAGLADGSLVTLTLAGGTPKESSSQTAHLAGVACLAYSPDGLRLASVGGDGVLRVWSVGDDGTLSPVVKFDGPAKGASGYTPLTGVAFSPDGRYIAGVGADAVVRVWDVQTKSEVRGLRGHTDWVTAVAFSPDGRHVASVGVEKDKALRVFELPALETTSSGGHLLAVNAVAVSPDGRLAATAGTDQTIKVWDVATGKEVATLVGNADTPFSVSFVGNNALVMGGSLPTRDAGRLHFWRTSPPSLTKSVPTGEVYAVLANAGGTKVAAWASRQAVGDVKNNAFETYDAAGKLLSSQSDSNRNVRAASFTPDLSWAVAGDDQGTIRIWDLTKKDERVGGDWPLLVNQVADIGISGDKKTLVAVDDKGLVHVGDVAKRETLAKFVAHKEGVRTLLVSPTGNGFVTVGNDREIKAWSLPLANPKEPKPTRTWTLPVGVNGLAFTPDGKKAVTANADGTAYVLELDGGDTN